MKKLLAMLRVLDDTTRLQILLTLSAGERDVTSMCREFNLPQPTVSHHLGLLRVANLIVARRAGKKRFYSLASLVTGSGRSLRFNSENYHVEITPAKN